MDRNRRTPGIVAGMMTGTAVDRALESGFDAALKRHLDHGVPVVIWEDEGVVEVSPTELAYARWGSLSPPFPSRVERIKGG